MVFPKMLRPSYLADKLLTLLLRIVLAILLQILFIIKGEDVKVTKIEVTVKKENEEKQYTHILDANKILKERAIDPKVETKKEHLVTGTPSELKSEEIIKDEINDNKDDKSEKSSFEFQEKREIPHLEIAR